MDAGHQAGSWIELRLLGPTEAMVGRRPVPLKGTKPAVLITALALDVGRAVSVDLLVEALWPETPPDTASHAVQVYVSQLRKLLGAEAIMRKGSGYALQLAPERVDLHRFVRLASEGRAVLAEGDPATAATVLREALGLWRGPALADFAYEPFAQMEIARLEELRLETIEARIDADLALGRHVDLIPELEALVQAHPLREHPRAQLMLALYRSGRQSDALAGYRRARETLVEELGLDPGPELRELEAAILRQDESLLLPDVPAMPAMQFRRLATILFVDVVDSMGIAEALDAEALGGVQRRYFDTVAAALAWHGGTVEKYAGDAVMAAFGVPVAHEDDALRAARAAFDVHEGVAALSEQLAHEHGVTLEIRVGLAAGEVVTTSTETRQRFVAGDAVGVAARLQQVAGPGKIVVSDVVARLIDHAARLEPLGEIDAKGRKAPILAFQLVELVTAVPAYAQREEAPFVGRKRELAVIRAALKAARAEASPRAMVVVGPAGTGKSRLLREFARRSRGITALPGRCLSYGEGITYWPLREIVRGAPASEERDIALAALEADTPRPAAEIALAFRRFCESLARKRPLVLLLDDVHWAEPTLLDVVEGVVDRGKGPILLVCLARDELDERPAFLGGRENVERLDLGGLSGDEADAVLDALQGSVLESDQRPRIVERADGNPLFLQQLLAFALEGGLVGDALPPTVQALLAARLDRLGPAERAVLERGAVVGKDFTTDDVRSLLEPEAVPTAGAHLETLDGRGFVRAHGKGAYAFRHGLVQEAVYRAAPKRLRAALHERYADRLDETVPDLPDLDEFVGYHLEWAYRLRRELGEADRRTETLADDAGRRLGDAGLRALKRGDVPASIGLLRRATSLLSSELPVRGELLCELAISLDAAGEADDAVEVLEHAVDEAARSGERRIEVRARMELEYVRLPRRTAATADRLMEAASLAIPVLEAAGDFRCLGRAWLLSGWVHGGRRGRHDERLAAAEQALACYRKSSWPTATCLGEIVKALYYGSTPVSAAIARCEELERSGVTTRYGRANVEAFLGGLAAQAGNFGRARELLASAHSAYEELGHRSAAATDSGALRADVELLAGDAAAAEAILRGVCDELTRSSAHSRLASRAGDLAEALYRMRRFDEAAEWVAVGETHTAPDDLDARLLWMPVHAKLTAQATGKVEEGIAIASRAAELAEATDALNRRAAIWSDMGEVRFVAGQTEKAAAAFDRAIELFELKENCAGAARVRALRDDPALV